MMPRKIIIHCSATPNGHYVSADEIKKWHLARGFSDIGYHELIEPSGDLEYGRPLNQQGAHCEGENHDSIGICLIGSDQFTRKAFDRLRVRLDTLTRSFSIEPYRIFCHNQFQSAIKQGKTCPNIVINDLLGWFILKDERILSPYLYEGVVT